MTQFDDLSHPAVELLLPLDGEAREMEIPRETTLFFWATLALGTQNRLPPVQSSLGNSLFAMDEAQKKMSWSISIDGESLPTLADSSYREDGYKGLAWWTAREPIDLPASVCVRFKMEGEPPTHQGSQLVLWTKQGKSIPWGSVIESTIELVPSDSPSNEFPTHKESLWNRHIVYTPQ